MEMEFKETQGSVTEHIAQWTNSQPYVPRNLIAIITRNITPFGEKGAIFSQMVKAIFETHAISIRGLWTGFSVDGTFAPDPEFRTVERYGRPIDETLMYWQYLHDMFVNKPFRQLSDEDNKVTKDNVTIDILFVEPDPTFTVAVNAWHGFEMYPDAYDGIESKRNLQRRYPMSPVKGFRLRHQPKPVINRFTLGYEAFKVGQEVNELAQRYLNELNVQSANPYAQEQFILELPTEVLGEQAGS